MLAPKKVSYIIATISLVSISNLFYAPQDYRYLAFTVVLLFWAAYYAWIYFENKNKKGPGKNSESRKI